MKRIADREIFYHFGYIHKDSTSRMVEIFDKCLVSKAGISASIQEFDASQPANLDEAVYRSVVKSISSTLERMTSTDKATKKERPFHLMDTVPEFDELDERPALSTPPPSPGTGTSVDPPKTPMAVKKAPQPFAKGGLRIAYHGYDASTGKHIVMKEFKWEDKRHSCLKRFMEVTQIHAIANSFVNLFNKEKPSGVVKLEFTAVGILEVPLDSEKRWFTFEPYISGEYTKFNGNNGYVSPIEDPVNDACQAFSHYTWVKSEKRMVVCDIQGVKTTTGVLLTDPAIHDKNILLHGATNLGAKGIKLFFQHHKCNHICLKMGLVRPDEDK